MNLNRASVYYEKKSAPPDEVELLNMIRDIWFQYPFYGYRRMTCELQAHQIVINHKRVQRLMKLAGIEAMYPKPKTSVRDKTHKTYSYLLRELDIIYSNQVWQVDITYLRMQSGFVYLVALIDVYSRYIISWSVSNALETVFCLEALFAGLEKATPDIVNSDQGSQFTSDDWIMALKQQGITISMTGTGRCLDNVFIERFWRSFKQEEFYLYAYTRIVELKKAIVAYVQFYNYKRWHQALNYQTPASVYFK